MPIFEVIPLEEARIRTAVSGRRAEALKQYIEYIQQLPEGQAGKLTLQEGEKIAGVRRRLGAAARLLGKNLVVKRVGNELYFWVQTEEERPRRRRRGRPRKRDVEPS